MSSRMWPKSLPGTLEIKSWMIDRASDSKRAWWTCISKAKRTPWSRAYASVVSAGKLEGRTRLRAPIGKPEESRMTTPMQELPPPTPVAPSTLILKKPVGPLSHFIGLRVFQTFYRFRAYFSHFIGLRVFQTFFRFMVYFYHNIGFRGIFVIL